jgi:ribosomal protein S18 acetylase RimI-like enzyme
LRTCYVIPEARAVLDLIPPGELTPGYTISRINVPRQHRGHGYGTRLLSMAIADADSEHADLWLEVKPSDGLTREQLIAWYARHGFKEGSYGYLVRKAS